MDLTLILKKAVEIEASDIFFKPDSLPAIRIAGVVQKIEDYGNLTNEDVQNLFNEITDERTQKIFHKNGEVDSAYEVSGIGRFRVNIYKYRGKIAFALRYVKATIPALDSLNLPTETLQKLVTLKRGLILVTGITGSGKSTTLAAMLEYVNQNSQKHIVTIEDPIEFLFVDKKSIFEQREVGVDTLSFASALKHVVRQNPDIIMIGEMRDIETIDAALKAAETGHLVLSTLHTVNAMQTVERIVNFFPPHQHKFLFQQLSQILVGTIAMRLLRTVTGDRLVPACEIMTLTPTVRDLIYEGKIIELYKAIKEGSYFGCQTFNQSLKSLVDKKLITVDEAISAADKPDELKLELRGILRSGRRDDFDFKSFK